MYTRHTLAAALCLFCASCMIIISPPGNDNDNANANANANDNDNANANDNADNANGNANDNNGGNGNDNTEPTLVTLDPITFTGDVPDGIDPVDLEIGGGVVHFSGGVSTVLGILPLYFDDSRAWVLDAPGISTIEFEDLDVRSLSVYFPHDGVISATLTALDPDGSVIDEIESVAAFSRGDPDAIFEIDGGGTTIAELQIDVPGAAVVTIDQLELTVAE